MVVAKTGHEVLILGRTVDGVHGHTLRDGRHN
jgi:hypothetical protein